MFEELLEGLIGMADSELDEHLRESELALRAQAARHLALVQLIHHRGSYRADGHRSVTGYLRATCNYASGEAARWRRRADVCDSVPELAEALLAGRVGVSQIDEIARIHSNPRTRPHFARVAPIFLARAEHASARELRDDITSFLNLADHDGAFAELLSHVEHRTASVDVIDGVLHVAATGGDPIVAEEVAATFAWFVEREFERDVAERAERHGDDAPAQLLPRADHQRRFDALVAMARAARAHGDGARPADVTVDVVADPQTMERAFAHAELVVDHDGEATTVELTNRAVDDILAAATADPAGWIRRRCETSSGAPLHPRQLVQAALTGYVRRVVVDSQGVVTDFGRRQRFFTGAAREAALLLARTCEFPGCEVPAAHCDVDHRDEWVRDRGPTDQGNGGPECRAHNRFKSRERWRVVLDTAGRPFHVRPDGTTVLPVGARQPHLVGYHGFRILRLAVGDLAA